MELTALERAEQTDERKRLYEALHPTSAKPQGGRPTKNLEKISKFSAVAADKHGVSDRSVRNEVAIARRIPDEVRDTIRHTPMADRKASAVRGSR